MHCSQSHQFLFPFLVWLLGSYTWTHVVCAVSTGQHWCPARARRLHTQPCIIRSLPSPWSMTVPGPWRPLQKGCRRTPSLLVVEPRGHRWEPAESTHCLPHRKQMSSNGAFPGSICRRHLVSARSILRPPVPWGWWWWPGVLPALLSHPGQDKDTSTEAALSFGAQLMADASAF